MKRSIRNTVAVLCLFASSHVLASLELLSSSVTPSPGDGLASANVPTLVGSTGSSFTGTFQSQVVAEVDRFEDDSFASAVQWADVFRVAGGPQYLSLVVGNSSTLTAWTSNSGNARAHIGNITTLSIGAQTFTFKDVRGVHCDSFWLQECSNPKGSVSDAFTGHPKLVLLVNTGDIVNLSGLASTTVSADTGIGAAGGTAATFTSWQMHVAPIPEPETYALMLLGLGLVAGVTRRHRARSAASAAGAQHG